jgi:hypothetical protein
MLAVLLCISTLPGSADRGGHGFRGHGFRGHGPRGHGFHHGFHHGFGGPRVAIGIGIGPFWAPYAAPVVVPPPVVVIPAAPPTAWYYCDNPRGYYPYVPQCPSGWRAVSPTPAP